MVICSSSALLYVLRYRSVLFLSFVLRCKLLMVVMMIMDDDDDEDDDDDDDDAFVTCEARVQNVC